MSFESAVVGVFTPWKWADAVTEDRGQGWLFLSGEPGDHTSPGSAPRVFLSLEGLFPNTPVGFVIPVVTLYFWKFYQVHLQVGCVLS